MSADATLGAAGHAHPTPGGRRRRRWWVYVLWVVGGLVTLFLLFALSAALYWNHLIRTYTSTQPVPLPKVENVKEQWDELKARWEPYAVLFIRGGEIPPIEFSAEDLNVALNAAGPLRNRAHLELLEGRLRVRFSVPLDESRNEKLVGRYLNGVAMVQPRLENGRIEARLLSVEANGKPIPKWAFNRLKSVNWLGAMNHRPETDLVVRGMQSLEVTPTAVVLHPIQGAAVPRR